MYNLAVTLVLVAAVLTLPSRGIGQDDPPVADDQASSQNESPGGRGPDDPQDEPDEARSSSNSGSSNVEEIVIIGEYLAGDALQEEAESAVVFGMDELRGERIATIQDLSAFTPNLEINKAFSTSAPVLFIRGVGIADFNANAASAVGVYQDGVYINNPSKMLFDFFDVAGVEVLRGPQGVKRRNSNAGAILVRSQEPILDEVSGYATGSYGNYNYWNAQGAVNVPVVPEFAALRASFTIAQRDGVTDNRCGDQDFVNLPPGCITVRPFFTDAGETSVPDAVNDLNAWAGRIQTAIHLPIGESGLDWLLSFRGSQANPLSYQYQHRGAKFSQGQTVKEVGVLDEFNYQDTDGDNFAGAYNFVEDDKLDVFGASSRMRWNPTDWFEIESLTSWDKHKRLVQNDSDASPNSVINLVLNDESWQLVQDLNTTIYLGEDVEIGLGGFYLHDELEVDNVFEFPPPPGIGLLFDQVFDQKTDNLAAWGNAEVSYGDVVFEGGVRYNWERKTFDISSSRTNVNPLSGPNQTGLLGESATDISRGFSGSLSATWEFMEEKRAYVKYSRGWKSGQFNGGSFNNSAVIEAVEPESVDSLEVGVRSEWFDGLFTANFALFAYKYADLQVFRQETDARGIPIPVLINAEDAELFGAEVDLTANPFEWLSVRYSFGWLDTEYKDFRTTVTRLSSTIPREQIEIPIDYSGSRFVNSPNFQMSGMVETHIPLMSMGTLSPRFSFSWKDDVSFDTSEGRGTEIDLPRDTIGQTAFWLFNTQVSYWSPDERMQLAFWMRNIFDEEYRTYSFDTTTAFGIIGDVYGDPRTFGVTLSYFF